MTMNSVLGIDVTTPDTKGSNKVKAVMEHTFYPQLGWKLVHSKRSMTKVIYIPTIIFGWLDVTELG